MIHLPNLNFESIFAVFLSLSLTVNHRLLFTTAEVLPPGHPQSLPHSTPHAPIRAQRAGTRRNPRRHIAALSQASSRSHPRLPMPTAPGDIPHQDPLPLFSTQPFVPTPHVSVTTVAQRHTVPYRGSPIPGHPPNTRDLLPCAMGSLTTCSGRP